MNDRLEVLEVDLLREINLTAGKSIQAVRMYAPAAYLGKNSTNNTATANYRQANRNCGNLINPNQRRRRSSGGKGTLEGLKKFGT